VVKETVVLTETREGDFDRSTQDKVNLAADTLSGVLNGARSSYADGKEVYVLTSSAYNAALSAVANLASVAD
jgi:N-acetylmuramoyl-L-alanine amidase